MNDQHVLQLLAIFGKKETDNITISIFEEISEVDLEKYRFCQKTKGNCT
jgi:hypothetical protein